MTRLTLCISTCLALTLLSNFASAQSCIEDQDILAVGAKTLHSDFTIYYSANHEAHAQLIAAQFPGIRDFLQAEFGINPDYAIALLDQEDFQALQNRKPNCGLRWGVGRNFFDLVVLPTPIESGLDFQFCRDMVESLTPAEQDTFALEAGAYPIEACYHASSSGWVGTYGFLLGYQYFGQVLTNKYVTALYLDGALMRASVPISASPELPQAERAVAHWYYKSREGQYEKPDVRVFEDSLQQWGNNDLEHFWWYLQWFATIADSLASEFGPAAAHELKSLIDKRGVPNSLEEFAEYFDEMKGGLKSVLLEAEINNASELPESVVLESNYPNPFNPSTNVVYAIPTTSRVTVSLVDLMGRSVRVLYQGVVPAGRHELRFDASGLSSGAYLLRLVAGAETRTRAITVIR